MDRGATGEIRGSGGVSQPCAPPANAIRTPEPIRILFVIGTIEIGVRNATGWRWLTCSG